MSTSEKIPERYLRFPLIRRIEHWTNGISFIILVITGLPQKYLDAGISVFIINLLGGIEITRIIHRISAVVLFVVTLWHIGYAIYHWYVKRGPLTMLPGLDDVKNGWETLKYNFGFAKTPPKQGFYTFEEKMEYWALIWGTIVMVVTGFFMWNPITAAELFPGELIPAAKAAHGGEAVLAALSIVLWHFYGVFVKMFNKSMYTGYLSRKEMEHEHPLALHAPPPLKDDPTRVQQRKTRFAIGYGLVALVWIVGIVWFVASEQTAVAAVPELEKVEVFVPLTPTPRPPSAPVPESARLYGDTWANGIGAVFTNRCADCHNPRNGEANLDLETLAGAFKGGDSGPAIVPGGPGVSLVVIWPTRMDSHAGRLTPGEAAAIRIWIANGAPEE